MRAMDTGLDPAAPSPRLMTPAWCLIWAVLAGGCTGLIEQPGSQPGDDQGDSVTLQSAHISHGRRPRPQHDGGTAVGDAGGRQVDTGAPGQDAGGAGQDAGGLGQDAGGAGQDASGPPPCQPATCAALGKDCGQVSNGCGGTLSCGTCPAGLTCGGNGAANVCGDGSGYRLPADRATAWTPGLNALGGIPARTTVCATVAASTYGNGAQDATAGIQAKLDACPAGQVVQLSAGTFTIDTDIVYLKTGVTLRGAGAGQTFLRRTNGAQDQVDGIGVAKPVIVVGQDRWTWGDASTNLTVDAPKAATSVTVASTAGLTPGMLVLVDELSGATWMTDPQGHGRKVWAAPDWRTVYQYHQPVVDIIDDPMPEAAGWFSRQDRPTSEIHEVASVSGNTVTFTTPLHISYRVSRTAQLTHLGAAAVRGAGLEGMTVTGGDDGDIRFVNAVASWAKGIEVATWRGEGFALEFTFRVEIRDSYIHDAAYSTPGGGAYALSLQGGTSEALIENNIVVRANKVIVSRCSGAGSVVGYNYMDEGFIDYAPAWQEMGVGGSHMVGPHHMLFEGNLSFNGDNDHTHGSSIYHTYFRNHLTGYRAAFTTNTGIAINDRTDVPGPGNGPRRCAGASAFSYWMSFVGNVLGLPGAMTGWTYEASTADDVIWAIGWENHGDLFDPDPTVAANLLRDGNFDYLTSSVHWHGIGGAGSSAVTLPDSLYLTAKPAFFNAGRGYVWPWVNPTGGTPVQTLPAKARFDAGTFFVQP
jgi:hypothetical protein